MLHGSLLARAAAAGGSRKALDTRPLGRARAILPPGRPTEGDLLAYVSDESGRREVMLRPWPDGSARWQVSVGGGAFPRWSAGGDALYYFGEGELRAVRIERAPDPAPAPPRTVSAWPASRFGFYDVAPDGRILALRRIGEPDAESRRGIIVVEGWLEELAGRRSR